MTYQQFTNTAQFIQNSFVAAHNIDDVVFIKDFKQGTEQYYGTNVDVLCLSSQTAQQLAQFLRDNGFVKEKISFEYDKSMYFPAKDDTEHTKVHIYPYVAWYTVKINFWRGEISDYVMQHNGYNIVAPLFEVPLLLFHAYFEDRVLQAYDVRHIRELLEEGMDDADFKDVLNDKYYPLFTKLFENFQQHQTNDAIVYRDFRTQLRFVYSTDNSLWHKLYYTMIHVAKKLHVIRG